ncbi:MAG TPA: nitronate monooxygenase, partial [Burkholderiaceae bacterium]|nr:nitronate monooxygenase [Burkholderiaceae bacterium]
MDKFSLTEPALKAVMDTATTATALKTLSQHSGLKPWKLCGKDLIPVVQGGMGVGVSAGGLAGTVAGMGGLGTISSVDLRRLHPDLMEKTGHLDKEPDSKQLIDAANLEALDREIKRAQAISQGRGVIAVNMMRALSAYEAYVRQALASGADALVVGAGLPLDLPDLAREFPATALIPILSDARGVQLLV